MNGKQRRYHSVTVEAEVDVADVLSELSDEDLADLGYMKIPDSRAPSSLFDIARELRDAGQLDAPVLEALSAYIWDHEGRLL